MTAIEKEEYFEIPSIALKVSKNERCAFDENSFEELGHWAITTKNFFSVYLSKRNMIKCLLSSKLILG